MRQAWRPVFATAMLIALGGCAGDRLGPVGSTTPAAAPAAAAAPTDMAGRWTFSAAGRGCAMNLAGGQGAEGAIRPEGGCPGNFYTSRKWTFDANGLVIRDHTNAALARLQFASPGRFEGQATGGQPVSLTR